MDGWMELFCLYVVVVVGCFQLSGFSVLCGDVLRRLEETIWAEYWVRGQLKYTQCNVVRYAMFYVGVFVGVSRNV